MILSIREHYNRRLDEAFVGIQGIRKIVDDVVVFDKDNNSMWNTSERSCTTVKTQEFL